MTQYSILIQWSEEDQLFLVTIPEFTDDLRSNGLALKAPDGNLLMCLRFPDTLRHGL